MGKGNKDTMQQISLLPDSYESLLKIKFTSTAKIIHQINIGVTKGQVVQLKDVLELTIVEMAEILNITDRALYLKKGEDRLSRSVADRAFAIAHLYSHLYNFFPADKMKADRWMRTTSKSFGDACPLDFCCTFVGSRVVLREISRLAAGIF